MWSKRQGRWKLRGRWKSAGTGAGKALGGEHLQPALLLRSSRALPAPLPIIHTCTNYQPPRAVPAANNSCQVAHTISSNGMGRFRQAGAGFFRGDRGGGPRRAGTAESLEYGDAPVKGVAVFVSFASFGSF